MPQRRGTSPPEQRIPPRPEERVAQTVRELRRDRGLSQQDLVTILNDEGHRMRNSALGEIERGEQRLKLDDAFALAIALDTTPFHLLASRARDGLTVTPTIIVKGRKLVAWLTGNALVTGRAAPSHTRGQASEQSIETPAQEPGRDFLETDDLVWLQRQRDEVARARSELNSILDILRPFLGLIPGQTRDQLANRIVRLEKCRRNLENASDV
jgi:transcriptional regulator with XRE-family HTH domain